MVLQNASFLVIDGITLTFGMTSFCMRLKYNVKDVFNCQNNSQFTIPVAVQATSLNIPAQTMYHICTILLHLFEDGWWSVFG